MDGHPFALPRRRLRGTCFPRLLLTAIALLYFAWVIVAANSLRIGGMRWHGSTDTLTTALSIIHAVLSPLHQSLSQACKNAGLNQLGNKAIQDGLPLEDLHRMDTAVRGSFMNTVWHHRYFWGIFHQVVVPGLAVLTSTIIPKMFTIEFSTIQVNVTVDDASLMDPTDITVGARATAWPAAILFNTTMSIDETDTQDSIWTYLSSTADPSGLYQVIYVMPALPWLVAEGFSGYVGYNASNIPSLMASVNCSNDSYIGYDVFGSAHNDQYDIAFGPVTDNIAYMQSTAESTTDWSCVAVLEEGNIDVFWTADGAGAWNISAVNFDPDKTTGIAYDISATHWNFMAISCMDMMLTTRDQLAWSWTNSEPTDPDYSAMVATSRTAFATGLLAWQSKRPIIDSSNTQPGEGFMRETEVVLLSNWALILVAILALLQCLIAAYHSMFFGSLLVQFGILQVMEMQHVATKADRSVQLEGNCMGRRKSIVAGDQIVAVRATQDHHLALVLERRVKSVDEGDTAGLVNDAFEGDADGFEMGVAPPNVRPQPSLLRVNRRTAYC